MNTTPRYRVAPKMTPLIEQIKAVKSSLVFAQDHNIHEVTAQLAAHRVACLSTNWLTAHEIISQFDLATNDFNPGLSVVLLAKVPHLSHGVRVKCSQIIWVGLIPPFGTHEHSTFVQSMNRGGMHEHKQFVFETLVGNGMLL